MEKQSPSDVILSDPLREITRKERTRLLITSFFGIAIVHTKLLPTRIGVLGIEFAQTEQGKLLIVLAVLITYFLVAFLLYATVDFTAWRLAYLGAHEFPKFSGPEPNTNQERGRLLTHDELKELKCWTDLHKSHRIYFFIRNLLSTARALFDFVLPIVVSLYAIIALCKARM